jgi:hypothetical protein
VSGALARLAGALRDEGGLVAAALRPAPGEGSPHAAAAAAGPRARGREAAYALLVEAIREGYELHYADGRVVVPDDPDLALLAGDRLYALGLAELAELGDLEAIAILADVISSAAQAHAEGAPERAEQVWAEGARRVGHGELAPRPEPPGEPARYRSVTRHA